MVRTILSILIALGPMAATPTVWASMCGGMAGQDMAACACCTADNCCCAMDSDEEPAPIEPATVPTDGMQLVRVILTLNPLSIADPAEAGEIVFPVDTSVLACAANADVHALFCIWLT
jgi:hypothetical protein